MATSRADLAPPTKVGSRWRPAGKGPHDDKEVRLAYGLIHLPALTKFLAGVTLKAIYITAKTDGWVVTLKGKRGRSELVAFFHGPTLRDALMLCATSVDINYTEWRKSKPRPKT